MIEHKLAMTAKVTPVSKEIHGEIKRNPYLATLFNCGSIVGFIPFYIRYDEKSKLYELKSTNVLHRILCGIGHAATFYYYLLLFAIVEATGLTFSSIVQHIMIFSRSCLCALYVFTLWRDQDALLDIINKTSVTYSHSKRVISQYTRERCFAVMIFIIGYVVGIRIFYQLNRRAGIVETWPNGNFLDIIKLLSVLFASPLTVFFTCALIAAIGLTMRNAGKEFCTKLASFNIVNEGLEEYVALKRLINNFNLTFGYHILACFIVYVTYFATIAQVINGTEQADVVNFLVALSSGMIMWLSLADFHKNVQNCVQEWILRVQLYHEDIGTDLKLKLLAVSNDNMTDALGIGCKFFIISYKFLGTMLGLVVTYGILILQAQKQFNDLS